jgi:hypothetical protein
MRTLKQKRMYEAQLSQLAQQTFNIESTALATENLRNTMVTLDAMEQANKELRKQYGKFDIDKIEVRDYLDFSGDEAYRLLPPSPFGGAIRLCNTIWRSCWNKRMRSRRR